MLLVKFDGYKTINYGSEWNHELSIQGFFITSKNIWESIVNRIPDNTALEYDLGDNEDIEFSSKQEYLSYINIVEISEYQLDLLKDLLNCTNEYGLFPIPYKS